MDFFTGQICLFPWGWAPRGWAKCDGSIMQIRENEALFTLIGSEFGGDGRTTFALPNLADIRSEQGGGDVGHYICLVGVYPSRR
jgi:microcystin-dependent protein